VNDLILKHKDSKKTKKEQSIRKNILNDCIFLLFSLMIKEKIVSLCDKYCYLLEKSKRQ